MIHFYVVYKIGIFDNTYVKVFDSLNQAQKEAYRMKNEPRPFRDVDIARSLEGAI